MRTDDYFVFELNMFISGHNVREFEYNISGQPFLFGRHIGIFSHARGIRNLKKIPDIIPSLKSITLYLSHQLKDLALVIK